jgi:hypothetical protein
MSRTSNPLFELVSVLSNFDKPPKRPEALPFSVLWSFDDVHHDPDAAPSIANKARPHPPNIIRKADGTPLIKSDYDDIEKTAQVVYRANLEPLSCLPGRPATFSFLKSYYPDAVKTAIKELESAHPVVGLCSFHWKAERLFQHLIQNKSNAIGKAQSRGSRKKKENPLTSQSSTTNSASTTAEATSSPNLAEVAGHRTINSETLKCKDPAPAPANDKMDTTDSSGSLENEPPAKKQRIEQTRSSKGIVILYILK